MRAKRCSEGAREYQEAQRAREAEEGVARGGGEDEDEDETPKAKAGAGDAFEDVLYGSESELGR